MNEMKELIEKTLNEKMSDGTFEAIVGNAIEAMMKDVARDLTSYNSDIRKYVGRRLQDVMSNAFKQTNFDSYVDAFKIVINDILQASNVASYKEACDSLKDLLGEHTEAPDSVKLTEIFDKFCEFVETKSVSYDDSFESLDANVACVNATMSTEKKSPYGERKVHFAVKKIDEDDESDIFDITADFSAYDYGGYGYVRFDAGQMMHLRNADKFERYLMKLSAGNTKVIFDEFDAERECDVRQE